ncbi:maleylpyruvate isomerase family mycothiol-dependent enzyme [Saccharothrix sp. BKS2]|uniref:maleylpyruvate isomerase family mycothiol-dependent enzyme n=1 Tax=Saccharothrix sp. BKS2 TaxID=3064400 RepID=UPI0039ED4274
MEHADFVTQLKTQIAALRAAAVAAGPDAPVPTCPGWTVRDLVDHVALVHSWVLKALVAPPDGPAPDAEARPEGWDELLAWWDTRADELVGALAGTTSDTPAWTMSPDHRTHGFWARRQAHEIAIHRLDAEHARLGTEVPSLLFDAVFAADGVDEYLTWVLPRQAGRRPIEREGRLVLHAADAGRAWEVRLAPGRVPEVGPIQDAATEPDATLAGTADALYRAVWGRPSGAVASGDRSLPASLPRP